jgi:hypothetical protein
VLMEWYAAMKFFLLFIAQVDLFLQGCYGLIIIREAYMTYLMFLFMQ